MQYLSIYNVSEYLYCQKACFYKLFDFEEKQDNNVSLMNGKVEHDKVHQEKIRYKSGVKQITNMPVFSEKLQIRGQLDLLEIEGENYTPIEFKTGKYKEFINQKMQLCLQCLCLEEMYNTKIVNACIYFIEDNKRYNFEIDKEIRNYALNTIGEIREKIKEYNPNLFVKNNNNLCEKCSFFPTCRPNLK